MGDDDEASISEIIIDPLLNCDNYISTTITTTSSSIVLEDNKNLNKTTQNLTESNLTPISSINSLKAESNLTPILSINSLINKDEKIPQNLPADFCKYFFCIKILFF